MQTDYEGEQVSLFGPDTWCGRTSPEPLAPTKEQTSRPSSKKRSESRPRKRPTFHYLCGGGGRWLTPGTETDGPLPTEFSMRSFGECPNAGVESRLSQILEATPHQKYSLSAKACLGIRRRAATRGKPLPEELDRALAVQSQCEYAAAVPEAVKGP